ncbi:fimbria/pilus periplasmic chaperone [Sansalvadorimonas sp. 2012CJ34-2]|uniref:Fimbria/pilus periplasmic chaperone n=1 Tax=Parendozoicomonas callyspongiae TaxID=2942213 RepID=A0ABT0PCW2_9GAMM|nr:fimbria/pilus periplasmic chaperone [Sansalvadorimonas sp. 2012CJ34-2]MCL6269217.1 fimbria/pilus periplasmic chaperone [Sansalvadorimonas sp. 2012CJ34-2]
MNLKTALQSYFGLTLLALSFLSCSVYADISVDKAIVEFRPNGEYYTDIKVQNNANKKAYVSVSIKEVIKPGQPDEKREELYDPDKALLVATPSRLIIEANQSSPVRLLNLDEDHNQERIYRVLVEPASAKFKAEQDAVQVLVSYDILAIVRPEKPVTKILASRKGKNIVFYNAGNTNIFLERGKQCNPANKSQCEDILGSRLYAEASWTTDLPFESDVEFSLNDGESAPTSIFNGKDKLPDSMPKPLAD